MGIGFTAFLCIIVWSLPHGTVASDANFSAYWNVFTLYCKNNISSVLENYEIQQNNNSYIGDKVALFYEYKFGLYPYYKDYKLSLPINRGTPQNVSGPDLSEHIRIAIYNITENIKSVNSSGLGVIDFEEWRPLFDINSVKKEVYKVAAIQITNATSNITDPQQLNDTAKKEYDEAARVFLLSTLNNASSTRPRTLWGMYGFPYCNYDAGTYKNDKNSKKKGRAKPIDDYRCRSDYRNFNDRMEYIFNASQALYPSIYLNNKTDPKRNFRYVQAIMAETLRVARNYSRQLPIYVYTKFEYDPLKELCSFYTKEDLCTTVVLPYKMGANGLIFWSSSNNMTQRCDLVRDFVSTTLGPLVKTVIEESRNNTTSEPYYLNSTMWDFDRICTPQYMNLITNFTEVECNRTLSTIKTKQ